MITFTSFVWFVDFRQSIKYYPNVDMFFFALMMFNIWTFDNFDTQFTLRWTASAAFIKWSFKIVARKEIELICWPNKECRPLLTEAKRHSSVQIYVCLSCHGYTFIPFKAKKPRSSLFNITFSLLCYLSGIHFLWCPLNFIKFLWKVLTKLSSPF